MTQDAPEQMRLASMAVFLDPRRLPKIHLQLVARRTLHPAKGRLSPVGQSAHKAFNRVISPGEVMPGHQVLVDALRRKPGEQTLFNDDLQRRTLADPTRFGAGGHNGWF
jgi:hypothetical protein